MRKNGIGPKYGANCVHFWRATNLGSTLMVRHTPVTPQIINTRPDTVHLRETGHRSLSECSSLTIQDAMVCIATILFFSGERVGEQLKYQRTTYDMLGFVCWRSDPSARATTIAPLSIS